jgi:outer membrane protein assembly factor BamD
MRRIASVCALCFAMSAAAPAFAQWVYTPEIGRFINLKSFPRETAELQLQYARSLFVAGDYSDALGEIEKFDTFYGDAPEADQNQFLRAEVYQAQDRYLRAAQEYQRVVTQYPGSPLYDDVIREQYAIGDALYDRGVENLEKKDSSLWRRLRYRMNFFKHRSFRQAIDVYELVTANNPFAPESAEAQFKIGRSHEAQENHIEAADAYLQVLEDYPDSPWVREAAYGLTEAYWNQTYGPDYDQGPSLLTIRSIREFQARFPEDERNDGLRENQAELWERIAQQRYQSARFYERRRDFLSARIFHVMVVNEHPETEAARRSQEWLDANPVEDNARTRILRTVVTAGQ